MPGSCSQILASVHGAMLFALPVGGEISWPISGGNTRRTHGCFPSVASWHTLENGFDIWSVGGSFPPRYNGLY